MDGTLSLGLVYGAALCAFMTALIVLSLRHNPMIWLADAPADVQARCGPMDARTRRQRSGWAIVMLVGLAAIFGGLARAVVADGGGTLEVFVAALVAFELFNLHDALVIDLGLVLLRPAWAFPPGAGDSPTYTDPRWHLINFAKGLVGGVPFAALVAALTWLVRAAAGA